MASSDLRKLERDLKRSADKAKREVPKITKRGAMNIKRQWQTSLRLRSQVYARALPAAVSFDDTDLGGGRATAEIGPDKGRPQGALGNLLEFGSTAHGTEAGKEGERALELETPAYTRYMEDLGDYGI